MQNAFIHLMDLIGIKKAEDLLFKVKPALKDKAENVQAIKENCSTCEQPNILAWTYDLNGNPASHRVSEICTVCLSGQQSKEVTDELIDKRKAALLEKWYRLAVGDNSGTKNYEPLDRVTNLALAKAKDYIKEMLKGNLSINCLLMGSTGTGKSHLAKTIAKTARETGLSVAYIDSADLFDLIKATFGHERHNEMLYKEYTDFDLVVIEDVGLETRKIGEVSWSVTEWTKLINARQGKASVWTTNFDDVALAEVVGQRAFSRMYENTKFIDLFTEDYRKKKMI
ncbi:ATP-binding protein [Bacillus sp. B-jedd]|uniref:ATP-binding protein n=1 Tax=Bacillus sp. B-jedd TaxID=1476857 RepID=UPI00051556BC|nr:ATP-binding protein [Bacillus sp. B-jedd]CEG29596.1 DnaC phage replication protein [Bacillus sp. B-jedd]